MGTKAAEMQRWENKGSLPKTVWVRVEGGSRVLAEYLERGRLDPDPLVGVPAAEIGFILCGWGGLQVLEWREVFR